MNLSQLASEPKLIVIEIDDEETLAEYKESVVFHTWDRQPMSVFMQLANTDQSNSNDIINICKDLILDEQGNSLLKDEQMLPTKLLMKAIAKVTEILGK